VFAFIFKIDFDENIMIAFAFVANIILSSLLLYSDLGLGCDTSSYLD
jgi:hypothetical protein